MGGSVHDARVKNVAMHDAQPSKITMHGARNRNVHFCVMNRQVSMSMSYIPNVAFNYVMIFVIIFYCIWRVLYLYSIMCSSKC